MKVCLVSTVVIIVVIAMKKEEKGRRAGRSPQQHDKQNDV